MNTFFVLTEQYNHSLTAGLTVYAPVTSMHKEKAYLEPGFHSNFNQHTRPLPRSTYLLFSPSFPSSLHFSLFPLDSFPSPVPVCFKEDSSRVANFPPALTN